VSLNKDWQLQLSSLKSFDWRCGKYSNREVISLLRKRINRSTAKHRSLWQSARRNSGRTPSRQVPDPSVRLRLTSFSPCSFCTGLWLSAACFKQILVAQGSFQGTLLDLGSSQSVPTQKNKLLKSAKSEPSCKMSPWQFLTSVHKLISPPARSNLAWRRLNDR
jgi:hypothetical protein